jgi:hypothetical protein
MQKRTSFFIFIITSMFSLLISCASTHQSNRQIANFSDQKTFEIASGTDFQHPYRATSKEGSNNEIFIAFENQYYPFKVPFKSEVKILSFNYKDSSFSTIHQFSDNKLFFYNPIFLNQYLYMNAFDVAKNKSYFLRIAIPNIKMNSFEELAIKDDLQNQLRPWLSIAQSQAGKFSLGYEFRNYKENASVEILRNHLHLSSSVDGLNFNSVSDLGTGVMPRIAFFKSGKQIFTRQNGNVENMKVFFKMSNDEGQWSEEKPISDKKNVHDAFPFLRKDGDVDLYYISSEGRNGFGVYRRSVNESGLLGREEGLTLEIDGSFTQPQPMRMKDGRVFILMAKENENKKGYSLNGLFLEGDSVSQPNQPGMCFDLLLNKGYMATYQCQLLRSDEFLNQSSENVFNQYTSMILSYLGMDIQANKIFDQEKVLNTESSVDLSNYEAVPVVDEITLQAEKRRIILVNEAHHVPQHRMLTAQLLKPLYDRGYRYLALETLNELSAEKLNETGIPNLSTGFYTSEPTFSMLIRQAKKIGFKIVAYDYFPTCDPFGPDPVDCQNLREQGQAKRIYDRIFIEDPEAKVLIHAGYGHIDKIGGDRWTPMAKFLWNLTGYEPYSIDQVELRERGNESAEWGAYRKAINELNPRISVILKNKLDKTYFVLPQLKGHYDVQILSPRSQLEEQRTDWKKDFPETKRIRIKKMKCPESECLISAYFSDEANRTNAIPADQILVKGKHHSILYLPSGLFKIKLLNKESKVLREHSLAVP